MEKPDVDSIEGSVPRHFHRPEDHLQKSPFHSGHGDGDLRLSAPAVGPHRHASLSQSAARRSRQQTVDQIVDQIYALPERHPDSNSGPGGAGPERASTRRSSRTPSASGFVRVRVDGNLYDLSEEIKLEKNKKHNIEIVVDRLVLKEGVQRRLTDSVETAASLSGGLVIAEVPGGSETLFSQNYACEDCGISIEELTPRLFSFNNPYGACPECTGLGMKLELDPELDHPQPESVHQRRGHQSLRLGTSWTMAASPGCISMPCPKNTIFPWTPR